MHAYDVHTYKVHAHEVHYHEVHAHEVHAREVHVHEVHAREVHVYFCAQQTGMHILVVEALLIATYSTWRWANTYTHRKILSVENLSLANSWSLSSRTFPAGSLPSGIRMYERTSLRIATEARPVRNIYEVHTHEMHACEVRP